MDRLTPLTNQDPPLGSGIPKKLWQASINYTNATIAEINQLIDQFNQTDLSLDNDNQRIAILQDVQKKVANMEFDLSANSFTGINVEYQQSIRTSLFQSIQSEFMKFDIPPPFTPNETMTLHEIIDYMSYEKALWFSELLAEGSNEEVTSFSQHSLTSLYPDIDQSDEAKRFRHFFSKHSISFLGGGNSRNFVIENIDTTESQVLLLENPLQQVKSAEKTMNNQANLFTLRLPPRAVGSKFLVITERCEQNLSSVFYSAMTDRSRLQQAASLFKQMADALVGIQQDNGFFPDAKNANWLINDGRLKIADRKSIRITPNGISDPFANPLRQANSYLFTDGRMPPELFKKNISVDKAHAYILGRNLLKALTGISTDEIEDIKSRNDLSTYLNNPTNKALLNTLAGREYHILLRSLWSSEPRERISVSEAAQHLKMLEQLSKIESLDDQQELIKNFYKHRFEEIHEKLQIPKEQMDTFVASDYGKNTWDLATWDLAVLFEEKLSKFIEFKEVDPEKLKEIVNQFYTDPLKNYQVCYKKLSNLQTNILYLQHFEEMGKPLNMQDLSAVSDFLNQRTLDATALKFESILADVVRFKHADHEKIKNLVLNFHNPNNDTKQSQECVLDLYTMQLQLTLSQKIEKRNTDLPESAEIKALRDKMSIRSLEEGILFEDRLAKTMSYKEATPEKLNEIIQAFYTDPAQSIPCLKALSKLQSDEDAQFKRICKAINLFRFGHNDTTMNQFINHLNEEYKASPNKAELIGKANSLLENMKKDTILTGLHNKVVQYQTDNFFTKSKTKKADAINHAMTKIPIEERGNIFTDPRRPFKAVQEALATHRYGSKKKVDLDKNPTKAAEGFINLKKLYTEMKQDSKPEEHEPKPHFPGPK